MTPFPRPDYVGIERYDPGRAPVPIDLSDNTNLWGPHPAALARLRAAAPDDLRCYPELYADTVRAAVSERFGVPMECVTTGDGSDDVIDSAFRAAYGAGQVVTYPAPTFSMIGDFTRMNGMEPGPVPWQEAVDDPARLLEGDVAVVYLCRPNNPTGAQLPEAWVDRLVAQAAARDGRGPLIVIDEAYADFARETLIARASEMRNVLVMRTCSKAYGLAGLRCSFAVASADVVLEVDKSRGPYKVSRLACEVAALAIRDEDGWVARTTGECLENRERLRTEIEKRGITQLPTSANFILVAAPSGKALDDAMALRASGVQVRPFTGAPELGESLRVTVGPWPLLEKFLEAFDQRLAALREVSPR
jgi:histidinol-phosphate aminotransferase